MKTLKPLCFTVSAILSIALSSCSSAFFAGENYARMSEKPSAAKIAVLDFEQEGFLEGEKLGRFAADELTTALFLKKKFDVADRSQVRAQLAAKSLAIAALRADEITALGQALDSDYLLLGKINRLNAHDFNPEKDQDLYLQITLRIISCGDGAVMGMVSRRESSRAEPREFVSDMLHRMAGAVKVKH
jgi:curli biogenesis system outer membrane secretion channel CsgG